MLQQIVSGPMVGDEGALNADLSLAQMQQAQRAALAALRATGVALYDVTFSAQLTVTASDLSTGSWQWTAVWAQWGGFVYPVQSLAPTDGSCIEWVGYVNGVFVVKSTPPRWQKWGGIIPGSTWTEEFHLTLTQPQSAAASIACTGCTHGAITRSIDSAPRFGLRSQALDG